MHSSFIYAFTIFNYLLFGTLALCIILGIGYLRKYVHPPKFYFTLIRYCLVFSFLQLILFFFYYFLSKEFDYWSQFEFWNIVESRQYRFYLLEQPLVNSLATFFISVGYSLHLQQHKMDRVYKRIILFYGLGLICFFIGSPVK